MSTRQPLPIPEKIAILVLIGSTFGQVIPMNASTRSLILLFALGGGLFLCWKEVWRTWLRSLAMALCVILYFGIVWVLFEQEAQAAKTVSPLRHFGARSLNLFAVHWRWVLPSVVTGVLLTWFFVVRKRGKQAVRAADGEEKIDENASAGQSVFKSFQTLYEAYRDKLGEPHPEGTELIYQAEHENAKIIWVDGKSDFYVLKTDGSKKLITIPGDIVSDSVWYLDEENKKKTKTPKGKSPPYGTVAMAWVKKPEWWKI